MITLSYCVNLLVLVPLLAAFARGFDGMAPVFGSDTPALRILVCIYAAIAICSAAGLALQAMGRADQAMALGISLFAVQIIYKLLTAWLVGFGSPVVMTNLAVVAVHALTLVSVVWRAG